jgi:hypothetical protein
MPGMQHSAVDLRMPFRAQPAYPAPTPARAAHLACCRARHTPSLWP